MTSFANSTISARAITDLQTRMITARPRDPTEIYLSPSEAAYFDLKEGDFVDVLGYRPRVVIVRPTRNAVMPGQIIERAMAGKSRDAH